MAWIDRINRMRRLYRGYKRIINMLILLPVLSFVLLLFVEMRGFEKEPERELDRMGNKRELSWTLHIELLDDDAVSRPAQETQPAEDDLAEEGIVHLPENIAAKVSLVRDDTLLLAEDAPRVQDELWRCFEITGMFILTIGFGHVVPRTTWGKLITIINGLYGIVLFGTCAGFIVYIMNYRGK